MQIALQSCAQSLSHEEQQPVTAQILICFGHGVGWPCLAAQPLLPPHPAQQDGRETLTEGQKGETLVSQDKVSHERK